MTKSRADTAVAPGSIQLEQVVDAVEWRLAALADALRDRDTAAVELQASELHRALANAVQCFTHVTHHGRVPDALRKRLAQASAAVARQRETLSRATAALDRAIEVLIPMPRAAAAVYGASGMAASSAQSGILRA